MFSFQDESFSFCRIQHVVRIATFDHDEDVAGYGLVQLAFRRRIQHDLRFDFEFVHIYLSFIINTIRINASSTTIAASASSVGVSSIRKELPRL